MPRDAHRFAALAVVDSTPPPMQATELPAEASTPALRPFSPLFQPWPPPPPETARDAERRRLRGSPTDVHTPMAPRAGTGSTAIARTTRATILSPSPARDESTSRSSDWIRLRSASGRPGRSRRSSGPSSRACAAPPRSRRSTRPPRLLRASAGTNTPSSCTSTIGDKSIRPSATSARGSRPTIGTVTSFCCCRPSPGRPIRNRSNQLVGSHRELRELGGRQDGDPVTCAFVSQTFRRTGSAR
jgi:hypothetical protein